MLYYLLVGFIGFIIGIFLMALLANLRITELEDTLINCESILDLQRNAVNEANKYWQQIAHIPLDTHNDLLGLLKFLMNRIKKLENEKERK